MQIQHLRTILLSAIFLILPGSVLAAPSVTSVSGTVWHNSVVTVNGLGFGVKFPVAPLLWDPVDGQPSYAGLTNGSLVPMRVTPPIASNAPWSNSPQNTPVYYKTSHPRGKWTAKYANSLATSGLVAGQGKASMGGNNYCSQVNGGKFYVTLWHYYSNPVTIGSNKFHRLDDNSATATFIWGVGGPLFDLWDGSSSSYPIPTIWDNHNYPSATWHRVETLVDNSKTLATYPHVQEIYDGTIYLDAYATTSLGRDICVVGQLGLDSDNADGSEPVFDYGEIYVDNTYARVEICNASTKASSNHCEIQIPQTTWNDEQIQIKVNQGSFVDNSSAYLYVIDASGNASAGKQLTFGSSGGGGGDTTPPAAPTGLSVR